MRTRIFNILTTVAMLAVFGSLIYIGSPKLQPYQGVLDGFHTWGNPGTWLYQESQQKHVSHSHREVYVHGGQVSTVEVVMYGANRKKSSHVSTPSETHALMKDGPPR
jgi:hypothetical protein